MISPLEIHRASRRWRCGWLAAWTRLRYQREFWQEHASEVRPDPRSPEATEDTAADAASRRRA